MFWWQNRRKKTGAGAGAGPGGEREKQSDRERERERARESERDLVRRPTCLLCLLLPFPKTEGFFATLLMDFFPIWRRRESSSWTWISTRARTQHNDHKHSISRYHTDSSFNPWILRFLLFNLISSLSRTQKTPNFFCRQVANHHHLWYKMDAIFFH